MTVEEKAPYLDKANKYWYQNTNIIGLYSKENEHDVKNAYIDGMADGEPKWHEIESHVTPSKEIEKQYMPKNGEKVLLKYHFYNDEEIHYSDGYYDNYDFEFHIPNNPTGRIICVIAWCELSKFEE